jgi:hypothetical protein
MVKYTFPPTWYAMYNSNQSVVNRRFTQNYVHGWLLGLSIMGCRPDLDIQSPESGAMLEGETPVEVVVDGVSRAILIESLAGDSVEQLAGDENHQVRSNIPIHDGLGFVSVETKSRPKASAVRSWHQGQFLNSNEVQHNIVTGRLDQNMLDSVSTLVEQTLVQLNLARYADNPVSMDAPLAPLILNIADARSESIDINAWVDADDVLYLRASLHDVRIKYQGSHDSLNWLMDYGTDSDPIYGEGTFDSVVIEGRINLPSMLCDPNPNVLCAAGSFLEDVVVTHSEVSVSDSNCEFLGGWIDLCGLVGSFFENQLPLPLADAAEASASHILKHLVQALDPQLEVQFDKPINRDLFLQGIRAEDNMLVLEYSALIKAIEPQVASEGQGVLERGMTSPGGGGICLGQPAINAIGFAAWDAGNFQEMVFDNEHLVAFGMPDRVPWSNIQKATVETTLPPVLEFREGSAWLDIGGIRTVVNTKSWGEAVFYSAGRAPVKPGLNEDGSVTLLLNPSDDGSRDIQLLGVGFEEVHGLLDRDDAVEIIEAVLPALMSGILADLAKLTIDEINIPALDDPGSTALSGQLVLDISAVKIVEDAWCVPAILEF